MLTIQNFKIFLTVGLDVTSSPQDLFSQLAAVFWSNCLVNIVKRFSPVLSI